MAKNSSAPVDTVEKPTAEICWGKFYDKKDENCANKCGLSDSCKVALAKVEALLMPMKRELFPGSYEGEVVVETSEPELTLAETEPTSDEGVPLEEMPKLGTKCSVCEGEQYDTPSGPVCAKGHGDAPPLDEDADDEEQEVVQVQMVAEEDDEEDLGKPKEESVDDVVPVAVVEEDDDDEDLLGAKEVPTKEELEAVVDGTPDEDEDDNVIELPVLPEVDDSEELAQEEENSVDTDDVWDNIDDDEDDEDE